MNTKTALVTGTSSGMGLATAQYLLDKGWKVVGVDLKPTEIEHESFRCIVTDSTNREALANELKDIESLNLVANIAGVFPPSTLETMTFEQYRLIFDVNVWGTLAVISATRPLLSEGSAIVNFASVDAFTVSPGQLLYGASKAAVVMLTKELALELAPMNIRVNAIAPGWVNTPGNAATGRMAAAAHSIPLGRVAQPEEIAAWVELLGSETAAFMSGETIVLSGGDVMR